MNWVFGKRIYNKKEEEYVMISSSNPKNLPEGKFITYIFDNDNISIKHNFRVLWKFKNKISKDGLYQYWYYIDNHTTETTLKNIQAQIDQQQALITDQSSTIIEHSDILDDIIIDLLNRD